VRIVGGAWSGRRITAPPGRDTRPTTDRVREAWMSAIGPELEGAAVLDLFAGSGALGLEALSRGARHVTFVENATVSLRALEQNITDLAVDRASVRLMRTDAMRFAEGLTALQFDVAVADPPYERGFAPRLAELFAKNPFARVLCLEHSRNEPLHTNHVIRERRYGDTVLTFLGAEDDT